MTIEEIAVVVKRTSSAVSHAIRTVTARLKDDPALVAKMATVARAVGLRSPPLRIGISGSDPECGQSIDV